MVRERRESPPPHVAAQQIDSPRRLPSERTTVKRLPVHAVHDCQSESMQFCVGAGVGVHVGLSRHANVKAVPILRKRRGAHTLGSW
jgi:hypothetical protein